MISSPKFTRLGRREFLASSAASRFTLASSEPTIARMLAVDVLVLAFGIELISSQTRAVQQANRGMLRRMTDLLMRSAASRNLASPVRAAHRVRHSSACCRSFQNPWPRIRETFSRARDGRKFGG
jgi:hypothetical protein